MQEKMKQPVIALVWAALLILSAVMTGCSSPRKAAGQKQLHATKRVTKPPLSHNDSQRLKYFFYEAISQQNKGNYDAAFDLLEHCLDIDSMAAEVYFTLSAYHTELQQDSMALVFMKRAAELEPNNDIYLERLGISYVNTSDYDHAAESYEQLYNSHKDRSDVLEILLQIYRQKEDYENMVSTLNRLESIEGENEQLSLTRMHVYSLMGDKENEYNELLTLSEKHPNDLKYRVMIGNWLLGNNRDAEAKAEYDRVLAAEPQNQTALVALLDFYRTTENDSMANALQEQLLVDPKTPVSTKITLMRRVVAENEDMGGDSTQVLDVFKRILDVPQTDTHMIELYAAYMSLKKMPLDSINAAYADALKIAPDNAGVRLEYIQNLWSEKRFDDIITLSQQGVEYNPDQMAFYYFLGLAHYQKDERDLAYHAFQRGVSQINEDSNKAIVSDFYSIMGDILHQKGKDLEAFAAYDSALVWKDDNIGALNNYAYYLSEMERDLQKAEQMSYQTIKAEPNNSTFLDTYAWILFMQGRYTEAMTYIDMAIENMEDDSGVILEHAGDIHAKAGDLEGAMKFWERAKEVGVDSDTLAQKIKQRKYIKKQKKKK